MRVLAASLAGMVTLGLAGPAMAVAEERAGGTTPTTAVTPTTTPPTTARTRPTAAPQTTAPVVPTTAAVATTVPSTLSTLVEPEEEDGPDISAATIALIVGVVAALVLIILVIVLLGRRRARDRWRDEARSASGEAHRLRGQVVRGLTTLAQPAAAAQTWSQVEDEGAQLHRQLQALAQSPPDRRSAAVLAPVDESLQELRAAVESDRALRLGPPPPTQDQLGYSEAVVRQRVADFEQAVEDLDVFLRDDR